MNDPTEKFLRTFEEIKTEVNYLAGDPSSGSFELEKAAERDSVIARNRRLLKYIREVRNVLQHPNHKTPGDAVLVSETFLEEVEILLERLRNPPTANSVGVSLKQMMTASRADRLGDLADRMKKEGFSHVPILDENDAVIGVFNEAAVFDHLWAETETIVGREMEISEILPHCLLDADHTETFRFKKPGTKLDELAEIFRAVESSTTRVGAVFITASGSKSEPLQRLITPWDVLDSFRSNEK